MSLKTDEGGGVFGISRTSLEGAWFATLAAGLLIGLYGVYRVLTDGTVALGISSQFPWGLLISTYEFFLLMGAGILISILTLALVFRVQGAELVLKRSVILGIASVSAGLFAITISLGRPERAMVHAVVNANLSSPIWWVVMFAGALIAVLVVLVGLIERDEHVTSTATRAVGIVGFLVALAVTLGAGYIFGMAEARPYYGGVFAPLYFLLTGVMSGVALVAFVVIAEFKLTGRRMCAELETFVARYLSAGLGVLVGLSLLFAFLKAIYGLTATSDSTAMAYEQMLLGSFAPVYWGLGIFVGLVVPLALLVHPRTRTMNGILVSSGAVIVGVFVTRYEFVVGGQVVALVPEPGSAHPIVSYAPSLVEVSLVVFAVALCAFIYTVARRCPLCVCSFDEVPAFAETSVTRCTSRTGGGADD